MNDDRGRERGRVMPRRNVAAPSRVSFVKQYEVLGYWLLLAVVLMLIIWFISASAADHKEAGEVEATVIATLFVPETATAVAEAEQTQAAQ